VFAFLTDQRQGRYTERPGWDGKKYLIKTVEEEPRKISQ